ncbi:unnamed protein product [Nyctereutes procyonoides]|uniref:(raccoon dog) hypothetical protein n=1 Tax=Nyctereutes procyonoides TaxID=34880 RepID=A0A811YLG7_NYCPR|nr:unnamed protein product [Nyctereutes procyonoides]
MRGRSPTAGPRRVLAPSRAPGGPTSGEAGRHARTWAPEGSQRGGRGPCARRASGGANRRLPPGQPSGRRLSQWKTRGPLVTAGTRAKSSRVPPPRPGKTHIPCTPRLAAQPSGPRQRPRAPPAPPSTAFLLELAVERTHTRGPPRNVTLVSCNGPAATRDSTNIDHLTGSQ